jgi:plastocyanin
MKGSFTVGAVTPPPPKLQKLSARVGPGQRVTFAKNAAAGKTEITVRDLTAKDNFHLTGPGVNRKTGVKFKGTVKWTVTLKAGTYTFRSDAHAKLRGKTRVT